MALVSFIFYRFYKNGKTEDGDKSDGNAAATLSEKVQELEFVVFNATNADTTQEEAFEEVLYTEVNVGVSKKNITGRKGGKQKGGKRKGGKQKEDNTTVDLAPVAIE